MIKDLKETKVTKENLDSLLMILQFKMVLMEQDLNGYFLLSDHKVSKALRVFKAIKVKKETKGPKVIKVNQHTILLLKMVSKVLFKSG